VPGETVFIGLGGNLGDRQDFCDRALTLLGLLPHSQLTGVSSYYETEPLDPDGILGTEWFYNAVARIETNITPYSLLEILQETERGLGRHDQHRAGPRTMDLDLLFYGQQIMKRPNLTIPHPKVHLRRFVLAPLVEIDPGWNHPILNTTVKELLDGLKDSEQIRKLDCVPGDRFGHHPNCSPPPQ
jgi:2-amino-4-hydroxy-6-hydroxymethyldihydropteridine diphosphokinase